jgi:hypothetical protein
MSTLSRKALTSARHSRRPGKLTKSVSAYWNAFDEKFGRVADEYNQDFIGGDDDR